MDGDVSRQPWFQRLCDEVKEFVNSQAESLIDAQPVLEAELRDLDGQIRGLAKSIANPDLDNSARHLLEKHLTAGVRRKQLLEDQLAVDEFNRGRTDVLIDPVEVATRLDRLQEVLSSSNLAIGNIELSLHIDKITCFRDKRVTLRTCRLGVLGLTAVAFLNDEPDPVASPTTTVKPRRRTQRRILDVNAHQLRETAEWAADPRRFAGLDERWFDTVEFHPPEKTWPYMELAIPVAERRLQGATHQQLAKEFNTTTPTIRKALRHAAELDEKYRTMQRKVACRRWHEDHAHEVAEKVRLGWSTQRMAKFFGKSEPTIRKATEFAKSLVEDPPPERE